MSQRSDAKAWIARVKVEIQTGALLVVHVKAVVDEAAPYQPSETDKSDKSMSVAEWSTLRNLVDKWADFLLAYQHAEAALR